MLQEQKNMANGIAGTVIFHLILIIIFLSFKLGEVKNKHQELISIEFAEEEYKPIQQIIEESKPNIAEMPKLDQRTLSNIVSNTAEEINEQISTEKYIEEVMKELGMDDINPQYDNTLPSDPELYDGAQKEKKKDDQKSYNFGSSRVEYKIEDGRAAQNIDRPIYKCQGGGTVVIAIEIGQDGNILAAKIKSTTSSEACINETALASARRWIFRSDYNSPKRVNGTITYIFVAQ